MSLSNEELGIRNEGGGFAEIDEEVAAVLAFVISHTTFLVAQDDKTGRCPKVPWIAFPLVVFWHRPFERKCQRFLACARNDDTREPEVS